jgi:hypothetical protein
MERVWALECGRVEEMFSEFGRVWVMWESVWAPEDWERMWWPVPHACFPLPGRAGPWDSRREHERMQWSVPFACVPWPVRAGLWRMWDSRRCTPSRRRVSVRIEPPRLVHFCRVGRMRSRLLCPNVQTDFSSLDSVWRSAYRCIDHTGRCPPVSDESRYSSGRCRWLYETREVGCEA